MGGVYPPPPQSEEGACHASCKLSDFLCCKRGSITVDVRLLKRAGTPHAVQSTGPPKTATALQPTHNKPTSTALSVHDKNKQMLMPHFLVCMVMGTGSVERFFSFSKCTDTDQRYSMSDNARRVAFMAH